MSDIRFHLFKKSLPLLNRGLDAFAKREQVIAKNIANATTPNYRPEKVRFEEEFQKINQMASGNRTDVRHIPIGAPNIGDIEGIHDQADVPKAEILHSGESHVNVDKEMAELAQTQIKFRFAARKVSSYFKNMQSAIRGTTS